MSQAAGHRAFMICMALSDTTNLQSSTAIPTSSLCCMCPTIFNQQNDVILYLYKTLPIVSLLKLRPEPIQTPKGSVERTRQRVSMVLHNKGSSPKVGLPTSLRACNVAAYNRRWVVTIKDAVFSKPPATSGSIKK